MVEEPLRPARRTAPVARRPCDAAGRMLTSREVRELAAQEGAERELAAAAERAAHQAWQAGLAVPYWITIALDLKGLDGPGVDRACGVEEPAVDQWELGVRYPTWEQLLLLADLTDQPAGFFTRPPTAPLKISDTTLIFHAKNNIAEREPVLAFTPEAIAATLGGYCAGCLRPAPGTSPIHTCRQDALFPTDGEP